MNEEVTGHVKDAPVAVTPCFPEDSIDSAVSMINNE